LKATPGPDFSQIDATMDRGAEGSASSAGATAVDGEAALRPGSTTSAESRSRLHWFIGTSDVSAQDPGALTYEPHFGLREKPFSLSSDPRFFYSRSSHGASFDTLTAGIRRREGILALMGEVGTGKTTLCRAVLQALDRRTFAAFVPDPFLSREDLLKTLLVDFGVVSVDEIRSGRLKGASRTDLSYPLYDFLASLQPLKAFAVVMIDEAHNLTTDLLEEIRILSDLEKNREKLLEVMLIGQPELQARLSSTEMRQLSQRVSLRCELVPLTPDDVKAYISHRLTVAGNDGRVRFTDQAAKSVAAGSGGIPRVVNLICDRALLKAAWSGTSIVNSEHVAWAAADLQMPTSRVTQPLAQPATVDVSPQEPEAGAATPALDLIRPVESAAPEPSRASTQIDAVARNDADRWSAARWLAVTAACAILGSGVGLWAARHSLSQWLKRQPNVVAPTVEARTPPPALPSPAANPLPPPPPTPVEAVSVTTTQRFVLQMATFQSVARTQQAMQELRAAGYRAYNVELQLQDGARVLAVLLGPYTELASAERDLDAARQLPGYGDARLAEAVPALLPPDSQP
jgi:type II secretory pathway predicted ATPase ExeA/cell division septation protein DedD